MYNSSHMGYQLVLDACEDTWDLEQIATYSMGNSSGDDMDCTAEEDNLNSKGRRICSLINELVENRGEQFVTDVLGKLWGCHQCNPCEDCVANLEHRWEKHVDQLGIRIGKKIHNIGGQSVERHLNFSSVSWNSAVFFVMT